MKCAQYTCALALAFSPVWPVLHAQSVEPVIAGSQEKNKSPWTWGPIHVSGYADGYASLNLNHPSSGANLYRNFDVRANQFSLSMANLTLEADAEPVGFRIDLGAGRGYTVIGSADPLGSAMNWVPQAYITWKPSKRSGTQVDFGKFYTSAGAEVTDPNADWNYSRSLLYALGPYYHFGLRVTQPVGGGWTAGFQLVNGWNDVKDKNSAKTIGLTSGWTSQHLSWFNSFYTGGESVSGPAGRRNYYDTVVAVTPTDRLGVLVNFDIGQDSGPTTPEAKWYGVAVSARYALTPKIAFSPRVEYFNDRNGLMSGTAQQLKEFTLTGEYKWFDGLISRLEYRTDFSNARVFERGASPFATGTQKTVLVALVASFGGKK